LFRGNNRRLSLGGAAHERGFFHPRLQLFVPGIGADII
jgi:hypothetical protein